MVGGGTAPPALGPMLRWPHLCQLTQQDPRGAPPQWWQILRSTTTFEEIGVPCWSCAGAYPESPGCALPRIHTRGGTRGSRNLGEGEELPGLFGRAAAVVSRDGAVPVPGG